MRAKHATTCGICRKQIAPGEEINKLLKKWVHDGCKTAEIARRTESVKTLHGVTEIPTIYSPTTQYVAGNERRQRRLMHKSRGSR